MVATTGCQHERTYRDEDEEKCRSCHRSLTYPPRPPMEIILSCIGCRLSQKGEVLDGKAICHRCYDTLLVVDADGTHQLPPRKLLCTCCKTWLDQGDFYHDTTMSHRDYKTSWCRGCTAFRRKVQREQDPEPNRARARDHSRKIQAERVAGTRPPIHASLSPEQKAKKRLAVKRVQARAAGQPVLLLRPGREAVHSKPICRIAAACPLREYCTTEKKGLVPFQFNHDG